MLSVRYPHFSLAKEVENPPYSLDSFHPNEIIIPMKRLLLALSASAVLSLQAAKTDPVGVVTITINGGNPAFTAVQFPIYSSEEGSFRPSSVDSSSLTVTDDLFAGLDFSSTDPNGDPLYFLEILTGPASGNLIDILNNTDNSLALNMGSDDLSSIVDVNTSVAIRKYLTLGEVFGENNESGLTSGGDDSSSDLIYMMSFDGSGSYTRTFYYQTDPFGFGGGTGWRMTGNIEDNMGDTRIVPDQALIVKRISDSDISISVSGDVKMSDEKIPLQQGFSLVGSSFPIETTLGESNLYTGGSDGVQGGGDDATADLVYFLNTDGTFTTYYYQIDPFGFGGGTGWRESGNINDPADSAPISPNTGIIILSRNSETSWQRNRPYLND